MPKSLFTKLIVQAAVGFFFVLVGCVYGIQGLYFYHAEPSHRTLQPNPYLQFLSFDPQ